jgi:hypothetical protein
MQCGKGEGEHNVTYYVGSRRQCVHEFWEEEKVSATNWGGDCDMKEDRVSPVFRKDDKVSPPL